MPRKAAVVVVEEEEINESKAGVVMLDDEYYFKITQRQYVFGKKSINKDGIEVFQDKLYPSTIESVLKIYFKELLVKKTVGSTMSIDKLSQVVTEIKADIKIIRKRLEMM